MKISRIHILSLAIFLACAYAIISLIGICFIWVISKYAPEGQSSELIKSLEFSGQFFWILFPLLYAITGFITGFVVAVFFNIVAKITGGIAIEIGD